MALYIPHSIFHLARLLYVRPENFGPYYVYNISEPTGSGNIFRVNSRIAHCICFLEHKLIISFSNFFFFSNYSCPPVLAFLKTASATLRVQDQDKLLKVIHTACFMLSIKRHASDVHDDI